MKLKEKMAISYWGSSDGECTCLETMEAYIAGFEKAREMAKDLDPEYFQIQLGFMGEEEI